MTQEEKERKYCEWLGLANFIECLYTEEAITLKTFERINDKLDHLKVYKDEL